MSNPQSLFREPGKPIVVDASRPWRGLVQFVSHGVAMAVVNEPAAGHTVFAGQTGNGMSATGQAVFNEEPVADERSASGTWTENSGRDGD